jgi:Tol biopolymer transport system component
MAEDKKDLESSGGGPKDITPNPLDELEKKAQTEGEQPAHNPEDKEEVKEEIPEKPVSFFESLTANRILQSILIVTGLYGLFLGLSPNKFFAIPAIIGSLLLTLASIYDVFICKKFKKDLLNLEFIVKYALSAVFGLLTILFVVELFKPFDQSLNKSFISIAFLLAAIIFCINFFLYLKRNKKAAISDTYMFISLVFGLIAIYSFIYFFIIPSFIFAFISGVLYIISMNQEPLVKDERYGMRMLTSLIIALLFLPPFLYALTIFTTPKINVLKYGPITPKYNQKLSNLAWAGNNWAFAFSFFDKKKKQSKVGVINALTLGITELVPEGENQIPLPEFIDQPLWNKKGDFLIFSGGKENEGPRNIWGVSLQPSLLDENDLKKLKQLLKDKTKPVGKPKVLLADIKTIIEKNVLPLTHKTAWAKDGKRFCFAAKEKLGDKHNNIYIANIMNQEYKLITKGMNKIMPLWSPEEEKLLYVSKTDSYTYFKISNYDGTNAHELDVNNKKDREMFPLWNASESKVIYIKNNKFIIMNANATNQQVISKKSFTPSPYWLTAEKKKVLLEYTDSGNIWRIFTINTDGKNNKEIFKQVCEGFTQPKWSYDGKAIAVGVNYGREGCIYRLDKDGKFPTKIYTTRHTIKDIEWSPDSGKIAFLVKKQDVNELWVVNKDATDPILLYSSTGEIDNFSWDKEGKRIAFDETYRKWYFVPKLTNVVIVHAMGPEEWHLLPYRFYAKYPVWSENGEMIAYIGWDNFYMPSMGNKIWIARIQ